MENSATLCYEVIALLVLGHQSSATLNPSASLLVIHGDTGRSNVSEGGCSKDIRAWSSWWAFVQLCVGFNKAQVNKCFLRSSFRVSRPFSSCWTFPSQQCSTLWSLLGLQACCWQSLPRAVYFPLRRLHFWPLYYPRVGGWKGEYCWGMTKMASSERLLEKKQEVLFKRKGKSILRWKWQGKASKNKIKLEDIQNENIIFRNVSIPNCSDFSYSNLYPFRCLVICLFLVDFKKL